MFYRPRIWQLFRPCGKMSRQRSLGLGLGRPNVTSEPPKIPRELPIFRLHCNPQEAEFNTNQSNQMVSLPGSENKQAGTKDALISGLSLSPKGVTRL